MLGGWDYGATLECSNNTAPSILLSLLTVHHCAGGWDYGATIEYSNNTALSILLSLLTVHHCGTRTGALLFFISSHLTSLHGSISMS